MKALLLSIVLLISTQAMAAGSSYCTFENEDLKVEVNLTVSGASGAPLVAPTKIDIEFKSWAYPYGMRYIPSMGLENVVNDILEQARTEVAVIDAAAESEVEDIINASWTIENTGDALFEISVVDSGSS